MQRRYYRVIEISRPKVNHLGIPYLSIELADPKDFSAANHVEMSDLSIIEEIVSIPTKVRNVQFSGPDIPGLSLLKGLKSRGYQLYLITSGQEPLVETLPYYSFISLNPSQTADKTHLERCNELILDWPNKTCSPFSKFLNQYPNAIPYIRPIHLINYERNKSEALAHVFKNSQYRYLE